MSKLATVSALSSSQPPQQIALLDQLKGLQQTLQELSQLPEASAQLQDQMASVQRSLDALAPAIALQISATVDPLRESLPTREHLDEVLTLQRSTLNDLALELGRQVVSVIDKRMEPLTKAVTALNDQTKGIYTATLAAQKAADSLEKTASHSAEVSSSQLKALGPLIEQLKKSNDRANRDMSWPQILASVALWLVKTAIWMSFLGGMVWWLGTQDSKQPQRSASADSMAEQFQQIWSRATHKERELMMNIGARPAK